MLYNICFILFVGTDCKSALSNQGRSGYLTGLSDLELDKTIIDTIMNIQQLDSKDKMHIMTTISALVRDAKARNTYA